MEGNHPLANLKPGNLPTDPPIPLWQKSQVLISCLVSCGTSVALIIGVSFIGNFFEIEGRLVALETTTTHITKEISDIKNSINDLDKKVDAVLLALARSGLDSPREARSLDPQKDLKKPYPKTISAASNLRPHVLSEWESREAD